MKKGPLSEEPLFCAHRARMKVSPAFSKVAGSRDSVPGRPPQRAEPPLCSHKRRRGSKGEPSPGVPPFLYVCACAPLRWEVVVGLPCHSTPFLWCLPKETVSSRQRKAPFLPRWLHHPRERYRSVDGTFLARLLQGAGACRGWVRVRRFVGRGILAPTASSTPFLCYNMLDPKSSMLKNVLFSGSYQSYNERVIGLSKHCLS